MFSKYILVGVINTVVTALIIFLLMTFNVDVYISNAIGYSFGIVLSFILNVLFTFSTKLSWGRFVKFISNCAICYIANLAIITLILNFFPTWIYFSQLCGMVIYTITGFIINKLWVMK